MIDPARRVRHLSSILAQLEPIPDSWLQGRILRSSGSKSDLELLPCTSWSILTDQWRKAMLWTEGLDRTLAVMLACATSTEFIGDQLWLRVISPASGGKTTLAEALSTAKKYVYSKDTISRLISGYQVDKHGSEDLSAINYLRDKTLIIQDGDTLLRLPNRDEVMSQLRAFYGRNLRAQYGNKMGSRNYEGVNTTIIICGTDSLHEMDEAELGQRTLTCRIMDDIDDEIEDHINLHKVRQVIAHRATLSNGDKATQQNPEMTKAMQLTGGYLCYLRDNAPNLLHSSQMPEWAIQSCVNFGKFISYMRARPSKRQDEAEGREMSTRLVSQVTRLALCLSVVLNKRQVDREVMHWVAKTTLDTARGKTLAMMRAIGKHGIATYSEMADESNQHENKVQPVIKFLEGIKAIECLRLNSAGINSKVRFRFTPRFAKLYEAVTQLAKPHSSQS